MLFKTNCCGCLEYIKCSRVQIDLKPPRKTKIGLTNWELNYRVVLSQGDENWYERNRKFRDSTEGLRNWDLTVEQ